LNLHHGSLVVNAPTQDTYANDAAIIADVQLNAWFTALVSESGGNMQSLVIKYSTKQCHKRFKRPVERKNCAKTAPQTRADLVELTTHLIWQVIAHGLARVAAFAGPLASPSMSPFIMTGHTVPDPTVNYTPDEILARLPRLDQARPAAAQFQPILRCLTRPLLLLTLLSECLLQLPMAEMPYHTVLLAGSLYDPMGCISGFYIPA